MREGEERIVERFGDRQGRVWKRRKMRKGSVGIGSERGRGKMCEWDVLVYYSSECEEHKVCHTRILM